MNRFPLLFQPHSDRKIAMELGCPKDVPWDFIAEREVECKIRHDQSVQTLAYRGGLSVEEILAIYHCAKNPSAKWVDLQPIYKMELEKSVPHLLSLLKEWETKRNGDKS